MAARRRGGGARHLPAGAVAGRVHDAVPAVRPLEAEPQPPGRVGVEVRAPAPQLRHDPRPALRKLKSTPVLALGGTLDLQVPVQENLGEIEKALKAARNKDVTIKILPGLNHLFQHATTGQVEEYSKIEETFAPEALQEISAWILAHTGPPK